MTAVLPIQAARPLTAEGWKPHIAALSCAALAIALLFWRDGRDMAAIWWDSSTFNHILFLPLILGWLVWQRLPELRRLAPAAWTPGLALVGAGAVAWLLGDAGGLALARHTGLVLMLQGAVVACLGKAVARGLTFPLFYALFLIPAGEEIVPLMQTVTADMCMGLLALAGIPAHIEGVFISTPGGYFEVAEACSGVKFLIAMVALSALVANLCFTSAVRRAIFVAVAVTIPVLANGVRAFGTIWIAETTDTHFAEGMDHVIYGWFFFAFVIALTIGAGWRFFDRKVGDPWFDPDALQPVHIPGPRSRLVRTAAAAVAIAAMAPLWPAMVAAGAHAPADVALPEVKGWTRVPATGRPWQPHFAGADVLRIGRYRNASGQEADLAIAVFARQQEGKELIAYGQGATGPGSAWAWTADAPAPPSGKAERITSHGEVREVVSFYRVGHILTGSEAKVKLETIRTRLLGGPQRAVAVLVSSASAAEGVDPRPAIDAFLRDLGAVDALADRAAGLPEDG
ncbi:MAG: exosortase A [Alphaproteobacteria bacterium]|nr:MAG: exosortase A [Alphaproteobacteria bacterium]